MSTFDVIVRRRKISIEERRIDNIGALNRLEALQRAAEIADQTEDGWVHLDDSVEPSMGHRVAQEREIA